MTVMTARTSLALAKYEPHCTMILQLKSHQCAWPILCHRRLKAAIVHDHVTHTHNSTAFKRHLSILSKHQSAENCLNIMRHQKKNRADAVVNIIVTYVVAIRPGHTTLTHMFAVCLCMWNETKTSSFYWIFIVLSACACTTTIVWPSISCYTTHRILCSLGWCRRRLWRPTYHIAMYILIYTHDTLNAIQYYTDFLYMERDLLLKTCDKN